MRRFKTKIAGVYGACSTKAAGGAAAFAEWEGGSPIAACTGKKRDLRGAIAYGRNVCWHQSQREAEAMRLAAEEAQQPFDLANWPLMRVTLLQLGDKEFI